MECFDSAVAVREEMTVVEQVARAIADECPESDALYYAYEDRPNTYKEIAAVAIKAYAKAIAEVSIE